MSVVVQLKQALLAFGYAPVLDKVEQTFHQGETVAILGRNGQGKSTLLRVIAGLQALDSGLCQSSVSNIQYVPQAVPDTLSGTVNDIVAKGLDNSDCESWQVAPKVTAILEKMNLDGDSAIRELSGGMKRRVLMAKALVSEPALLLLDEPTNHLDVTSITWLESVINGFKGTVIVVSHDRAFLENTATRIVELDRGQLYSYPGNYQSFLVARDKRLEDEEKQNALFDKRLAAEEVWIRQGIKARRTRNEGRVRALKALRRERAARREKQKSLKFAEIAAHNRQAMIIEAEHVIVNYDDTIVVNDFSCLLMRGDKVGIIGPNGCGKTTLLNALLGECDARGDIKRALDLEVAYFTQMRHGIDETMSVLDNVAGGQSYIDINGKHKHVISYLEDFLFTPDQSRAPVKKLSGGERNRLMLAKLFTRPAQLLVMDEPTNDLDIETIELLEALLVDYKGTLLIVSHDRSFLENVVTSFWVAKGNGQFEEWVGDLDGALARFNTSAPDIQNVADEATTTESALTAKSASSNLSYEEKKQLKRLPKMIEKLEQKIDDFHQKMGEDGFYELPKDDIDQVQNALNQAEKSLEALFIEWEQLEGKQ